MQFWFLHLLAVYFCLVLVSCTLPRSVFHYKACLLQFLLIVLTALKTLNEFKNLNEGFKRIEQFNTKYLEFIAVLLVTELLWGKKPCIISTKKVSNVSGLYLTWEAASSECKRFWVLVFSEDDIFTP